MKKILSLVVVASLMATPALALGPGPDDPKPAKPEIELTAAAEAAARELVRNETENVFHEAAVQDGDSVAGGKLMVGIGLVALGAGLIWKGADLYESEGDPFGRKKNADSFLAVGVGGVMAGFGVLAIRGGLAGRGFRD